LVEWYIFVGLKELEELCPWFWRESVLVVRVRVRLNAKGSRSLETSAIANSGYESFEPEIVVPETVAERLGLFPELPRGQRSRSIDRLEG